jgi:hypothetical protein
MQAGEFPCEVSQRARPRLQVMVFIIFLSGGRTCLPRLWQDGGGSSKGGRGRSPGAGECGRCRGAGVAMMFPRFGAPPYTPKFLAKAMITMNSGGGGIGMFRIYLLRYWWWCREASDWHQRLISLIVIMANNPSTHHFQLSHSLHLSKVTIASSSQRQKP